MNESNNQFVYSGRFWDDYFYSMTNKILKSVCKAKETRTLFHVTAGEHVNLNDFVKSRVLIEKNNESRNKKLRDFYFNNNGRTRLTMKSYFKEKMRSHTKMLSS